MGAPPPISHQPQVVLLTGGLGGARLAPALRAALGPDRLTVIANSGDDLSWMGLRVCPDLDSVLYALAGRWDAARGWGLRDETWHVRDQLAALGQATWFGIGDRDLAYHLQRGEMLRGGATLTQATQLLASRLGVTDVTVLPASDAKAETQITTCDGRELHFQEWYVRDRALPEVRTTRLAQAPAAPAALAALQAAGAVILGPSNPISSIGAIVALEGIAEAVRRVPIRIAVSPVVNGIPLDSPGVCHHALARARLLAAEGAADTPAAIAPRYAGLVRWFVLDQADTEQRRAVQAAGLEPDESDLLNPPALAQQLVRLIDRAGSGLRPPCAG